MNKIRYYKKKYLNDKIEYFFLCRKLKILNVEEINVMRNKKEEIKETHKNKLDININNEYNTNILKIILEGLK